MTGNVFADNRRVEKAGQQVPQNSKIEIKGKAYPWVSRGGVKLNKAILEFNLDCKSIIWPLSLLGCHYSDLPHTMRIVSKV